MKYSQNVNLKPYHTFGIDCYCSYLVEASSPQDIIDAYQNKDWEDLPKIVIGRGSNMLFTQDFNGVVILNRLVGIAQTDEGNLVKLAVQGGEDWPQLVQWAVENDLYGLENLALIPGCAGSAPIQNIGAYGVEFKDVCDYVRYLDLTDFSEKTLTKDQCLFGYRDSIFKNALYQKAVIIEVGLKLHKDWQPVLSYGPLKAIQPPVDSAIKLFQAVCDIRRSKLPDPKEIGNAGSFFKNPIISSNKFNQLKDEYPSLNGFKTEHGIKIPAGWLIDQCNLKGYCIGGAQVHQNQALVLINQANATANDVIELAWYIKQTVLDKFGVALEHEVRFMDNQAEIRLEDIDID